MKRFFTLFLCCFIISPLLISCTSQDNVLISADEAESIVLEHTPDATISECSYNESISSYIIDFKTDFGFYEGRVNGFSGKLTSVAVKEKKTEITEFENYPEEETEEKFISIDTALAIALSDSRASGTAIVVKREIDQTEKVFRIIFRSGDNEYSYIIDAVTGDILSSEVISNS